MTRKTMFLIGGMSLFALSFAQTSGPGGGTASPAPSVLRTLDHQAFKVGEKLTYVVHYGWLNAGEAVVELKETSKTVNGRKLIHAVGTGRSLGAFNMFYKVDDHYETYMDAEGVFPWIFIRRVNEGGFTIDHDYIFHQNKREVSTQDKKTYPVPAHVQDMLSAFYYARALDFSKAKKGDMFTIDCFLDNENWPLRMRYLGKETIKLREGKYRCLKFQPVIQEGRIFEDEDDLNVWVTDDPNHVPVLVRAKVLVGAIKMELTDYEGLPHPIAKVD